MSFDYVLTPQSTIYRSVKDREQMVGEWYTFAPEESFSYGDITGEFKAKTRLRLLDITKNAFYNDFTGKITEYIEERPEISVLRMRLLFPLGFPDSTVYNKFADTLGIKRASTRLSDIELDTQYYGNRSRYSVIELDQGLVGVLKDIYPDYDGIAAPVRLPNILMNGYQHRELCVFNKDNISFIKEVERSIHSGGHTKPEGSIKILSAISLDNEMIRDFKRGMENYRNSTSVTTKPAITPNIVRMEGNTRILGAISLDNEMIRDFKRGMEDYKNTMKPLPSVEQPAKGGRKTRKRSGPKN